MNKSKLQTLKYTLEYKDYFEIRFQLDHSYQRVYAIIIDKNASRELENKQACFGKFDLELFSTKTEYDFDMFDHLRFLHNINKFVVTPGYYSSDGRKTDAGVGLYVILQDKKLKDKLITSIKDEIQHIKSSILDKLDLYKDVDIDIKYLDHKQIVDDYYNNKIKDMEDVLKDYNVESDKYKNQLEEIEVVKSFYNLLNDIK